MEETLYRIQDALMKSFENFGTAIANYVPIIISALVILLVGWIISKIVAKVVLKALEIIKLDDVLNKIGLDKMLAKIKDGLSAAKILSKVVYYILMLLFVTSAAQVLGWDMITNGIASFISYIPTLSVALVIFVVGVYIAELIKNMIYTAANSIGVSGAKAIANIVYYLLFIFIAITALNQAGVDTDIITSNITLILGSLLLAFAISYGFASRNLVSNLLSSYYGKGKFTEGQRIRIGDSEGTIVKIDSISVTLQQKDQQMVFPSRRLVEEDVIILSQEKEQD
jgi:hypothetical protein